MPHKVMKFTYTGQNHKTEAFLGHLKKLKFKDLDKYGQMGVEALREYTPAHSALTAASWYYWIERTSTKTIIHWNNSNLSHNIPVAVLLQYGHATKNGGFVEGIDYINPALQPIFDQIAESAWKEVTQE